jgi:hypothetical protein
MIPEKKKVKNLISLSLSLSLTIFYFFTSTFIQSFFSMGKERTSLDGTIVHTSTEIETDEDIQNLYQTSTNNSDSSFMEKLKRVDWLGTIFTIGLIVCLLLAMNWGASYG